MAWIVSGVLSSLLFGGMLAMIGTLLAARWGMIAGIVADGASISRRDDQLLLPLRFAA